MRLLLIISMVLVGLAGPAPVSANSTVSLGSGAMDIAAGQTAPLPVNVSDIQGLYGFEIHLSFDPAVVEVVDADPGTPGIQVKVGDFLAPDFVVLNRADNQTGKIDIGLTQMNPHEAKSGSGTLFTISFLGRTTGQSTQVQITNGLFSDRDGIPISVAPASSTLARGCRRIAAANPDAVTHIGADQRDDVSPFGDAPAKRDVPAAG